MINLDQNTTILVVDDEEMLREVVSSYLEKKGFHVLTAATGKEALELFDRAQVSFLILDLMLPDLSGEELCSLIRQKSRVPVIMLTAKTMEEDMLNGLHIGADDYMTKAFQLKGAVRPDGSHLPKVCRGLEASGREVSVERRRSHSGSGA